jgi:BirA family biotin operon repressor/biotin-[acetyl-CoA-carboxylase] ligase
MNHIRFESIDSTNSYLKAHWREFPTFQIVSAKHQTAGRGRMGNVWIDDESQALFSVLWKDTGSLSIVPLLSFYAAVAVHQVLHKDIPDLSIKWPNDLLVGKKKLCGILVETVFEGSTFQAAVIGIGLNANTQTFPPSLADLATSVFLETGEPSIIEALIASITTKLQTTLEQDPSVIIGYCNAHFALKDKPIRFQDGSIMKQTVAIAIDEGGRLIVETDGRRFFLVSGEVSEVRSTSM